MSEIKRRDFLKVLGLTGAGTGLVGCSEEPINNLLPYLVDEEQIIPGIANYYASVCGECPAACGVHVKTREGRPIKVEGNPEHPANRGALCARGQASLQGLYNPDRITSPLRRDDATGELQPISWEEAETLLADRIQQARSAGQADRIFLMTDGSVSSLDRLFDEWMSAIGSPNRITYDSFDLEPLREANRVTFGRADIPRYQFDQADLIISFGADFLDTWISPIQYARSWTTPQNASGRKARLVHVAPRLSLTGSNADEWVQTRPGGGMHVALGIAHILVEEGQEGPSGARGADLRSLLSRFTPERAAEAAGIDRETIERLAEEFAASASLALPPGSELSANNATAAHVAVNLLNYAGGSVGDLVRFGPNVQRRRSAGLGRLTQMTDAMRAGNIDVLMVHGTDPVYSLPAGIGFGDALDGVGLVVSFASFMDETAARADLILPDHTPLESWGDRHSEVGVHGLMQPTINPLFDTKQTPDLMISVAGRLGGAVAGRFAQPDFHAYLQEQWRALGRELAPGTSFDAFWREALSRGGAWGEGQAATESVALNRRVANFNFDDAELAGNDPMTLLVYPSAKFYDGRGANRSWLQELPDPMTKIVWNSWIEIHPERAAELGVEDGDVLRVTSGQGSIEGPAYVYRGIHRDAIGIPIGQGHDEFGRYARGRGVNPLDLLPATADAASGGIALLSTTVSVEATGRRSQLVKVQASDIDEGREVAGVISLAAALREDEGAEQERRADPDALVEAAEDADPKSPYRWGMVIDTSSCIGCAACVVACNAENNVPVVGEQACAEGREMQWIRIERYYEHVLDDDGHGESSRSGPRVEAAEAGEAGDFHTVHLPMLCQHCGNAPCEPVCPVYATYHNPEGLNVQVYNRCVGTRYCSNNCPYKVRRFEFYQYEYPYPLNLQLNPDVTVREKGVMEKCTFCVQRIVAAKNDAAAEGRFVGDGEMVPACAQTCPTQAIVFGNLRDPDSRVSQLARGGRSYHVLGELNTRPAVTYLKKVAQVGGEA